MIRDAEHTITDPVFDSDKGLGIIGWLFKPLVRDVRDLPFVRLSLLLTALLVPAAVVMFWPGMFRWWMAPIYWALYLWFLGPFILMLHNTSHRVLFKARYGFLNHYIPWVVGPFVGQSPETYYAHHMGIHHVDGNLPDDLSSTMPYQRDSFFDFLLYFVRFLFSHLEVYRYFRRNRRPKMWRRFLLGETVYLGLTIGLLFWSWQPAVVVFVVPLFATRMLLMAGNWAQHAFIDPDDPTNDYKTVTTFINSPYNHRCFNDGYHLGHHLKASRHWLDMPQDFLDKKEQMKSEGSLVFTKLDYFMIFVLLMAKRYRTLARRVVQLDPQNPISEDELVALMRRRLQRFPKEALTTAPATPVTAGSVS